MIGQVNRAELLWRNWEEKLQHLQGLPELANADPMVIKRQQYEFLRMGLYRLSVNPVEREQLLIGVMASVRDKLERQLYPGVWLRFFYRVKAVLWDKPRHLKGFAVLREESMRMLKGELTALGFGSVNNRLERYLVVETDKTFIALTSQLAADKRFGVTLNLEGDGLGRHRLAGFDARLLQADGERSFRFSGKSGITATEAANLLSGNAVRKPTETVDGGWHYKWLQLDFGKGEAHLQEYHEGYGYDLKTELVNLGKLTGVPGLTSAELIKNLEAGNQTRFAVRDKGPYYVQADPAGRGLKLFDQALQPLELSRLLKETRVAPVRSPGLQLVKETNKEQAQSFEMGH